MQPRHLRDGLADSTVVIWIVAACRWDYASLMESDDSKRDKPNCGEESYTNLKVSRN